MQGLSWTVHSPIISFEPILQICCSTHNYTITIKNKYIMRKKAKNISYLLSQFWLKYIKMKLIFFGRN